MFLKTSAIGSVNFFEMKEGCKISCVKGVECSAEPGAK